MAGGGLGDEPAGSDFRRDWNWRLAGRRRDEKDQTRPPIGIGIRLLLRPVLVGLVGPNDASQRILLIVLLVVS